MKEWDAVEWWDRHFPNTPLSESLIRALAAEAERRGMLKAAGICSKRAESYDWFQGELQDEALACAAAIERAAKGAERNGYVVSAFGDSNDLPRRDR